MFKRLLSILLAMALTVSMLPVQAFAVEAAEEPIATETVTEPVETVPEETIPEATALPEETLSEETTVQTETPAETILLEPVTVSYNPFHGQETLTPAVLNSDLVADSVLVGSLEELIADLRSGLVARESAWSYTYVTDAYSPSVLEDIMLAAYAHTGNPKEGDYLKYQTIFNGSGSISSSGGIYTLTLSFTANYYASGEQEQVVNQKVEELLAELDLDGLSDYQKIRKIYDWVTTNVRYDYDNLGDSTYLLKYSAYAALVNKTAVCQGYANLMYRLLLEADVDCRIISTPEEEIPGHSWNIVKLGNVYYNIDSTWDEGQAEYSYFLLCPANFDPSHNRAAEFTTAEFHGAYPMAAADYVFVECQHTNTTVTGVTEPTCKEKGYTTYTCNECGVSFTDNYTDTVEHNYIWMNTKQPTCTTAGYSNYLCKICGHGKTVELPAAHSFWLAIPVAPTCTEQGYTIYSCKNCDYSKQDDFVDALGHSYDDTHTCTVCGQVGGTCGENVTWVLKDGVLTISGTGEMENYNIEIGIHAPWILESFTNAVIESGVITIGNYAFYGCNELEDVEIPASVTSLGNYSFSGCDALTEIEIPDTVISIGRRAFYDCVHLVKVTLPKDLTKIEEGTFSNCSALTIVEIPDSVTSLGKSAFSGCNTLTAIEIPDSVTSLGASSFGGCDALTKIRIPDGVTILGDSTFYSCDQLTEISLPDSLTKIEESAFAYCDALTEIEVPDTVTSIGSSAFYDCSGLVKVTLPKNLTKIEELTFYNCNALTEIKIPDGVTSLGESAFNSCDQLTVISLPDSLTKIEESAFAYCDTLTEIKIPDGVTSLGEYAFAGCTQLAEISLPDSLTEIGRRAFEYCYALTAIEIPVGVTSLGSGAFCDCEQLTEVSLPDSLTEIGSSAFESCRALTAIEIPDSVTSIGESTFSDCSNLASIEIPDGVTSVGSTTFAYCTKLTSVTIPATVTSIGYKAFSECNALTDVYYGGTQDQWNAIAFHDIGNGNLTSAQIHFTDPCDKGHSFDESGTCTVCGAVGGSCGENVIWVLKDGVLTISGTGAIMEYASEKVPSSDKSFTKVVIETGITSLGYFAFSNCEQLTEISLPDSLTEIKAGTFYNCDALTAIEIPDGVTNLGQEAFTSCNQLTEISLPESLTAIQAYTFADCTALTTIEIPSGVTSLGTYAFADCGKLAEITIPVTVTSIGYGAFEHCINLTDVYYGGTPDQWNALVEDGNYPLTNAQIHYTDPCADGHSFTNYVSDNNATCTTDGTKTAKCDNCDATDTIADPGSMGHRYDDNDTCTVCGQIGGTCGENATWTLADGVLTISGEGDMEDYAGYAPWHAHQITEAVIEEGITSIGKNAFNNCDALVKVTIPETVTAIDNNAFIESDGLTELTIPASVASLGDYAFTDCSNLTTLTFLGDAPSLGEIVFWYAGLTTVHYPNGNPTWTTAVKNSFGSGITWIADGDHTHVFDENHQCTCGIYGGQCGDSMTWEWMDSILTISGIGSTWHYTEESPAPWHSLTVAELRVNKGVHAIGECAFLNCTALTKVSLPENLLHIHDHAFKGCTALEEIQLPQTLIEIGASAFADCDALAEVQIPDSVTTLGMAAFSGCSKLQNVVLPQKLDGIGASVFRGCTALGNITIPDSVKYIGTSAFEGCSALIRVKIPAGLTRLGDMAFAGCTSLMGIVFQGNAPEIGTNAFQNVTATAIYPANDLTWTTSVMQPYGGNITWTVMADHTHSFNDDYLCACGVYGGDCGDSLTWLLEDGVLTISGTGEMWDYYVNLPGDHGMSFYGETPWMNLSVTCVVLPIGLTHIGEYGFYEMDGFTQISVPAGVTGIGKQAFKGCDNLTEITFTGNAPDIAKNAFYGVTATAWYPANDPTWSADVLQNYGGKLTWKSDVHVHEYDENHTCICGAIGGTCGENLTWELTDGLLTISGTGAMEDYEAMPPWAGFQVTEAVIESGVTQIGVHAFYRCSEMTKVTIPDTVTTIDGYAFHSSGLTDAVLPDSVTTLGNRAFANCANLKQVTLSKNLTAIEDGTFMYCGSLKTLEVPNGVTTMGDSVFVNCGNLESIALPETITSMGEEMFTHCSSLSSITLPGKITRIGWLMFYDCTSLTEITIPADIKEIGEMAFEGCTNLRKITFLGGAPTFDEAVFSKVTASAYYPGTDTSWNEETMLDYSGTLTWIPYGIHVHSFGEDHACECGVYGGECGEDLTWLLEEGVLTISGEGEMTAYQSGSPAPWAELGVETACITEGVTSIGSLAFHACTTLTEVQLSQSVTKVGFGSFANCSNLSEITLPDGLTSLGTSAFANCAALTEITIPEGISVIALSAFNGCSALHTVNFPDGLTTIGGEAFEGCSSLTELTIPGSVTDIHEVAFTDCTGLRTITFRGNAPNIGTYTFVNTVVTAYYPDSNLTWTSDVLQNYGGTITWIPYGEHVHIFGEDHLCRCGVYGGECGEDLTWLLEEGILTISGEGKMDNYDFVRNPAPWSKIANIQKVILSDGVTSIGDHAFRDCKELTSISIPGSVTYMGSDNFYSCQNLSIHITDLTAWCNIQMKSQGFGLSGYELYLNEEKLEVLTIPEGITSIGYHFSHCISLNQISMPNGFLSIGDGAFAYCTNVTSVSISEGVTSIGDNAFEGCSKLSSVRIPDSVTGIGKNAFAWCSALIKITIPVDITSIREGTFSDCTSLTEISIPDGVVSIEKSAFYNCTQLPSVTIPGSVTSIESVAFGFCSALSTISFEGGAPTFGENAFLSVTASAYYPGDNDTWTADVMQNYGGTITWVPVEAEHVHSFGEDNQCECGITGGVCGENLIWTWEEEILTISGKGDMFHFEARKSPWKDYTITSLIVEEGVTSIGQHAFENNKKLTAATIADTVTKIGDFAFYNCDGLPKITLPDSVTTIGNSAFSYCRKLQWVGMPAQLESLGNSAFYSCDLLESITIPEKIKAIGSHTFYGCDNLKQMNLPAGVTTLGAYAFYNCASLKQIQLPDSVTTLGDSLFAYCKALTGIEIPAAVTSIGSKTFDNCLNLRSIYFYGAAPSIGTNAFVKVTAEASYPADMSSWNEGLLQNYGGQITWIPYCAGDHHYAEATCIVPMTCIACGVTQGNALGHSFTNYISNADSGCVTDGTKTAKCDRCDETDTVADPGSAKGHSYSKEWSRSNGGHWHECTGCGTMTDYSSHSFTGDQCNVCGHERTHVHRLTLVPGAEPSCDAAGSKAYYTCSGCNDWFADAQAAEQILEKSSVILPALGHSFTHFSSNGDAACMADGTKTAKCDRCEETQTLPDPDSALGHSFTKYKSNGDATCTTDGTKTAKCDRCDETQTVSDSGSVLGHSFTKYESNGDATCTKDGTKTSLCDRCDETDTLPNPGSAKGHTEVIDPAQEATCQKTGLTEGKHCDVCKTVLVKQEVIPVTDHVYENGSCIHCGDPQSVDSTMNRISGSGRCQTAIEAAKELKKILGISRFNAIVVADGDNYPDALSGSYLAAVAKAPILLIQKDRAGTQTSALNYIKYNLNLSRGTVYILGGKNSVSEDFENSITAYTGSNVKVVRLAGSGRYATSLKIIQEADKLQGKKSNKILVCDGTGYADSLSASATGLPVLLVDGKNTTLTAAQESYLKSVPNADIFVIGGKNSVSEQIRLALNKLDADGNAKRLSGSGREQTSVAVAKEFFPNPTFVVLADGNNYPDGLSGGPLAYAKRAPLLLIREGREAAAKSYIADRAKEGYILGGKNSVTDTSVKNIFGAGCLIQ